MEMSSGQTKLGVKEYAERRGMDPQLVYYYIRTKRVTLEHCPCCGNKVVDIVQTDEFFNSRDKKKGGAT